MQEMGTKAVSFCALYLFTLFIITSSYQLYPPAALMESSESLKYARFADVEIACEPILSSASRVEFDAKSLSSLRSELSFGKGDWVQDSGDAPLIPFDNNPAPVNAPSPMQFDNSDAPHNSSDPVRLSSFTLMHVDTMPKSQNAINVSGALGLGISWDGSSYESDQYLFSEFRDFSFLPGASVLRIRFEGVYVESVKNGGERVLCLLGNAMLPSHESDSSHQPTLLQDDQILLILRYPKNFTLTTRVVQGQLSSLNPKTSIRFFDKVHLSSQLGIYSNYQFTSAEIMAKACSPYPYRDDVVKGGNQAEIYKGAGFCEILDQFVSGEVFSSMPNWNCNSTDEYCSKLGPFSSERETRATDGGFANVRLMMQDIRCEPRRGPKNVSSAHVSAVIRAIPPWENQYLASQRTGLSGMTLSAEGIWVSTAGQLCMVGCAGIGSAGCGSRICLYIATSFSIKQRYVVFGKISSISNNSVNESFYPLSFERSIRPLQLWNRYGRNSPVSMYKYSKIELAGAFLDRSEPFDFTSTVKKSLLSYPKKGQDSDELNNLSNLSDDLTLHVAAVPDPYTNSLVEKPFLEMEVLSLGSLFGRSWIFGNVSTAPPPVPQPFKDTVTERQLLLNVSAELTLSGKPYKNVSVLYLEGLYNPADGRMYLIGCRDVRASWKILSDSMDLENGLDCLIEVKIEYPSTTARWLTNPTVSVLITSQRTEDDPLHLRQIKLQTLPILYREQRDDILSRRRVEGILRILTLSLAIACILSQLVYIRRNTGSVPFMSLVMLAVQAIGYSIPLITGTEALFARVSAKSYEAPSYEFDKNQWYHAMDYTVKILVLGAFLLTLRLGQKVWKSRIKLLTRSPLEPRRVPNDKRVGLVCFIIHLVGFLVILLVHSVNASTRPVQSTLVVDLRGNSNRLLEWEMQLEEYVGLVQDFFLLPQVIGNILWQIDCKPLRKTYYIGITVVRLLPHVYDYIKAPVFNPYLSEEYEFVNPSLDFFSKFGDVAIPVIATLLAVVVYIQQKLGYQKLSQYLKMGSRVYERLPAIPESELVSTNEE